MEITETNRTGIIPTTLKIKGKTGNQHNIKDLRIFNISDCKLEPAVGNLCDNGIIVWANIFPFLPAIPVHDCYELLSCPFS